MTIHNPVLDAIRARKHAGALMLDRPGPNPAELDAILEADEFGLRKAKGKAEQPPCVVALMARVDGAHAKIVASDQWLTVGAALQNLWLAAESLGFACGVSSGRLLDTAELRRAFGAGDGDAIVSIVSIGTPKERQPPRPKPALADVVTRFPG